MPKHPAPVPIPIPERKSTPISRHPTSTRTLSHPPVLPLTSRQSRIPTPVAILHVEPQRLPYEAATTVVVTGLPEVRGWSRRHRRSSGPISWDQRRITARSYLLVPAGYEGCMARAFVYPPLEDVRDTRALLGASLLAHNHAAWLEPPGDSRMLWRHCYFADEVVPSGKLKVRDLDWLKARMSPVPLCDMPSLSNMPPFTKQLHAKKNYKKKARPTLTGGWRWKPKLLCDLFLRDCLITLHVIYDARSPAQKPSENQAWLASFQNATQVSSWPALQSRALQLWLDGGRDRASYVSPADRVNCSRCNTIDICSVVVTVWCKAIRQYHGQGGLITWHTRIRTKESEDWTFNAVAAN